METKQVAKELLKRFKPYFDETTGELTKDAPESAVKAFRQFNELVDSLRESGDYKKTPPYFENEKDAKKWGKHCK